MELTLAHILLLGLIVFVTQTLEGVTGFGSTVLALPFAAMLLPLGMIVPVLATHTLLLAVYIVVVSWKHIVWKEFGFIALHVSLGLPIGYMLFKNLDDTYLKGLLALFMIGVAVHGIRMTRLGHNQTAASAVPAKKSPLMRLILFLGGIIHGAFATGGPFVVIYASRALKDKTLFRVSLCLLWLCMNSVLLVIWIASGDWTRETNELLLVSLPFLLLGIFVGDYLHHRASEYLFRLIVYGVLAVSGAVLMFDVMRS